MPQGTLKGKIKLPKSVQLQSSKPIKQKIKERKNKPIVSKKSKHEEAERLKKIITKNVNRAIEEQVRAIATDSLKVHLSKRKNSNLNENTNKMPPKEIVK